MSGLHFKSASLLVNDNKLSKVVKFIKSICIHVLIFL